MGLNGDLVYWKKATPIPVSISVIANSDDDENLTVLADSERVAKGKIAMNNDIIMNINYPNGSILILTNGQLTSAPLLKNVASQGRIKTNTYSFIFENKI
ncbi:MAG: hypothetical protein LBF97_02910 [Elusimicrobiota bacterium]|jgi:hypothetical protein|nr:hypothetical protein [Elusimicrobiota bacterium]